MYHYPSLSLATTDRDVLERFVRVFGVGNVLGPYQLRPSWKSPRKPLYQWKVGGARTRPIIAKLLPYLGERRSARAREVFGEIS